MRAGKLDRTISIERVSVVMDDYGNAVETWTPLATVRAQIIESSTEEFIRAYGASSETVTVFRARWLSGVGLADRVTYAGAVYNILGTKELGRRQGLEIRARAMGG